MIPNGPTPFENPVFIDSMDILMDDVDVIREEIKDRVVVSYPVATHEHGMTEFAIDDNNACMLQFGQEMRLAGTSE